MTTVKYEVNNTIRLKGDFRNFEGNRICPDIVYFKLYDENESQIESVLLDKDIHRDCDNAFYYDYTFNNKGIFYYEFFGQTNEYYHSKKRPIEIVFCVN